MTTVQPMRSTQSPTPSVPASTNARPLRRRDLMPYLALGTILGIILVKGEVVSWYRIQEMFRFQSLHMYGVLGSAFFTALVSVQVLRRVSARSRSGDIISIAPKVLGNG